jgi:hypothetical protein
MALDSKSLSEIVSSYSLDLSELELKSEGPLSERYFQKRLDKLLEDKLLESYGSYGYRAYILLGNLQIRRAINYDEKYVLYSSREKIKSKEAINIIFKDSPRYKEIEDSIDKYAKNGGLYLPQKLEDPAIREAEIDALVIARGYDGKLFLYNIELKRGLMKNENDERYKKAHLQLFRSTDVLINALLETEIISKDSEFYTFSILYSRYWYGTVYLFVYKNGNLYAYYVNNENKSIKYQIPLNGLEMKKYVNYSKDDFEYSMEKRGIIQYLLGFRKSQEL